MGEVGEDQKYAAAALFTLALHQTQVIIHNNLNTVAKGRRTLITSCHGGKQSPACAWSERASSAASRGEPVFVCTMLYFPETLALEQLVLLVCV